MNLLSELDQRLFESERRLNDLLQHLEKHVKLQESLRSADNNLHEASDEVRQLANSAETATQQLAEIVPALQEAVKILRRSDPAKAAEAVAKIEDRLKSAEQGIREEIVTTTTKISDSQDAMEKKLETCVLESATHSQKETGRQLEAHATGIREAVGRATAEIASGQKRIEEEIEHQGDSIRGAIPTAAVYATLVLVVIGLVIQFFSR